MDLQKRLDLVSQVGEEIVTFDELKELFAKNPHPVAYDGFEPSGKIHVAAALLRAINVNKMTSAGCKFKMLVADWHAWANNKMGGSLDNIQTVGEYLIEVWKTCGMDLANVEFAWASDLASNDEYWKKVMQIARNTTVARVIRCGQIMGRKDSEVLQASQILYPCMQAADIFHLKANVCQLGMDQRKVNMLAREVGPKLGYWKPVVVSHHMLMGLSEPPNFDERTTAPTIAVAFERLRDARRLHGIKDFPQVVQNFIDKTASALRQAHSFEATLSIIEEALAKANAEQVLVQQNEKNSQKSIEEAWKEIIEFLIDAPKQVHKILEGLTVDRAIAMKMSKSKPDSAIFMTDPADEVERKIMKAYCPEKQAQENPILEYCRYIIFEKVKTFDIERPSKFGGNVSFDKYADLEYAFVDGRIHPMDLKKATAVQMNKLLEPVRKHFEKDKKAGELLEAVNRLEVTR